MFNIEIKKTRKSSLIILLLFIVLLGLLKINTFEFFDNNHNYINKKSEPCSDDLSDVEYLNHMIPHHQVAIDIS